jgi:glycosyltransferase involved in cell wall biosynthesis
MRIAFIVQPWDVVYPKDNGGGSSIPMLTYQLARRLANMKNEVVIYSRQVSGQPLEEMDEHGIFHRRIDLGFEDKWMKPLNILDRFQLLGGARHPLWASSLFYPGFWRQIGEDLARWNPDIVHIHDFSQFVPMVRRIVPKAKIVLHMHTDWLSQLDAGMIGRRLRHADLILGCSEYISRKVRQRFPELSDRCQTIYNGADLSQFSPQEDPELQKKNSHVLLYAGRLSPEKGVHVLLDAFGIVLKRFPDAGLQIAGGIGSSPPKFLVAISEDKQVQDLARFYKIPPPKPDFYYQQLLTRLPANEMQKVSFLGPVPYTRIQDIYHNAGIYINSSLAESFTLPILEAMASGLPVIASEVGGTSEVVRNEETGLLLQPGDPESLAKAIIRLFEDEKLCQRLRVNAMQEIKGKFSWETLTEELWRQYQSLSLTASTIND